LQFGVFIFCGLCGLGGSAAVLLHVTDNSQWKKHSEAYHSLFRSSFPRYCCVLCLVLHLILC